MTTAARNTKGATLSMGTTPGALTAVTEILDMKEPGIERDVQDATTHDSPDGAIEYIEDGTYRVTEMQMTVHKIAGSTDDLAFTAAAQNGGIRYFSTTPKAATGTKKRTFAGYVISYEPGNAPVKGKQTATITIQPTGAITQEA